MNKKILCAVLFCLTAPLWGAQTESLSCAVERAAFQAKQEKISLKQEAHARFATAADFYSQTRVGEYVDSLVSEQVFKSVGPENSDLVWQVVSVHVPQEAYEACWTALDKMGKLNFSANRRAVNGKIKESHNLDTHTFRWKEIVYRLEGTGSHLFSIKAPLDGNVLHGAHSADKWAKSFQITFCADVKGKPRGEMFQTLKKVSSPLLTLEEESVSGSFEKHETIVKEISLAWPF